MMREKIFKISFFSLIALFLLFANKQVVYASYDTFLQKGIVTWNSANKTLSADWSPGDRKGGDDICEGRGVWDCDCRCVDEGQSQSLYPYIELEIKNGSAWSLLQKYTPSQEMIFWDTDQEKFTTSVFNKFDVSVGNLSSGSYRARFCLRMYNNTDPDESYTECKDYIEFSPDGGSTSGSIVAEGTLTLEPCAVAQGECKVSVKQCGAFEVDGKCSCNNDGTVAGVFLSWTDSATADTYDIYRSDDLSNVSFANKLLISLPSVFVSGKRITTYIDNEDLKDKTIYRYRMQAFRLDNTSRIKTDWSNEKEIICLCAKDKQPEGKIKFRFDSPC